MIEAAATVDAKETWNNDEDQFVSMSGFKAGAQWAQRELLSHLWHGASEEPQGYNKWVIIKYDSHPYISTHQVKKNEHWENMTKGCPSFHWLYLDDILPEKGGER